MEQPVNREWTAAERALLGTMPDASVARLVNLTPHVVQKVRNKLGIAPYKPAPTRGPKPESEPQRDAIQRFLLDRRVVTVEEVTEACRCSEAVARRALDGFGVWSAASGVWRVRR